MLQLAEQGYDVWMGNNRGTEYSMQHVYLDPKRSGKYWEFTWEDMGKHDIPAFISEIKKVTGYEKIHYIGFS